MTPNQPQPTEVAPHPYRSYLVPAAVIGLAAALWIGHPALALALGALLALVANVEVLPGSGNWGKRFLQAAVVLLALRLDIREVTTVSGQYLPLVASYVILTLIFGLLMGRLLKTEGKSAQMLAAGTAICGGTAVASLAPVIGAKAQQIAPVLALIFLLNAVAIILLPVVGHALNMSQSAFGLWVALAVHDTSSVLGTAAAYGGEALELATTVKLGRTLWLIPLLVLWSAFVARSGASGTGGEKGKISVPGFVLLFVAVASVNGMVDLPTQVPALAGKLSGWLLIAALFCIGLDMRRETLANISPRLLVHALGLWLIVLPITWYFATRMTA